MLPYPRRSSPALSVVVHETLEPRTLWSVGFAANVDFGPATEAPVVDGYVADVGQPFGPRADGMTYGWDKDVSRKAKTRASANAPSPAYEDFIAPGRASWSIAVPVGTYAVTVTAGNGKAGVRANVDVEGVVALDAKTTRDERWATGTVAVEVTDGMLTVSPGNDGKFKNNRLAIVGIASVGSASGDPGTPAPADPAVTAPAIAWAAGAADAPQTRVEAGVARVGSKLYVMGGFVDGYVVNNKTDVFDAAANTWSAGPDFPGSQTHASVTSDGVRYIYKVAGQIGDAIPGAPTADAWVLDTQTNQWSSLPALPEARYAAGAAFVDGKLHVFGGDEPDRTTVTTTHWVLDPTNLAAGWQAAAPLPTGGDHLSVAVVAGQIYAIGGEHGHATHLPDDAPYIQHDTAYRYDPAADAWTKLASLPVARSHAEGTTVVVNDKILVIGGKLNPWDVSSRADLYDQTTNTWTRVDDLPVVDQGGAAIYYDGKVYLSHGQEGAPDHTMYTGTWVGTVSGF